MSVQFCIQTWGIQSWIEFINRKEWARRKMLYFLNWRNASQLKWSDIVLSKSIFHAKKSVDLLLFFFSMKNINLGDLISNYRHRIRKWQQNLAVFRISWWTCRVRWWIFTNFALYCDEYEQTIQTIQVRKYFVAHTICIWIPTSK